MVHAAAQEPGQEELRAVRSGYPPRICDTFLAFKETEQSKIFPNAAFGYWKVTVERPLRISGIDPKREYSLKEIKVLRVENKVEESAPPVIRKIHKPGKAARPIHGLFEAKIGGEASLWNMSLTASCARLSRYRYLKKEALRHSSAAKSCRMRLMPGSTLANRDRVRDFVSPVVSTSLSRYGP